MYVMQWQNPDKYKILCGSRRGLADPMLAFVVRCVYSFVTKMAHHIKVKAQDEQSSSSSSSSPRRSATAASVNDDDDDADEESLLVELCPQFVWSVRDFTLQLDLDGKQATPDEYLERCLQEKPGKTPHHIPLQIIGYCFVYGVLQIIITIIIIIVVVFKPYYYFNKSIVFQCLFVFLLSVTELDKVFRHLYEIDRFWVIPYGFLLTC